MVTVIITVIITVIVTVTVNVLLQCTDAGVSITLLTLLPAYAYTVCAVRSPWHMGSFTGDFTHLDGWQMEIAVRGVLLLATGAAASKPGGIEERQGRECPPLEEPAVPTTASKPRHCCCGAADQSPTSACGSISTRAALCLTHKPCESFENLCVSCVSNRLSINTVSALITGLDQLQRFTAVCQLLSILFCLQMQMSSFLTSALLVQPTACASLCTRHKITLNDMLYCNDCCLPEEKESWSMENVKASLMVTIPHLLRCLGQLLSCAQMHA